MRWQVPNIWDGGDAWVLGGGPSVLKQFGVPESVVTDVVKGVSPPSVYSSYMEAIHKKHVIGINAAYLIGDWIDVVFFGDKGFYLRFQESLAQFPGLKVTCHPVGVGVDWLRYVAKDNEYVDGITPIKNKVSWNLNSGAAAISLAAHMGAKRIILLGFDMKLGENKYQHWHDVYKRGTFTTDKQLASLPFHNFLLGFPAIARDAKNMGIEIINANPDSAIKDFPKCNVKDLLP